ncbi:hypothetical protein FOA52_007809 [Chlamydomonas sp. UWO 241]|nr:hypothetical protein FOA52_007809 [Chlamydomonas sp. UWO 241]
MFAPCLRLVAVLAILSLVAGLEKAEEVLIGWQGDSYKPKLTFPDDDPSTTSDSASAHEDTNNDTKPWIQVLSWKPRAFVYHNFLSQAEVAHILRLARPLMKRSMVVGANNSGTVDNVRTSAGTFLPRNQDRVIASLEHRLSMVSHLPVSHQEDLQVLRYGVSNKYGPHCDGLGRVMSVLIYLVAPEEGGETAFPQANAWLHPEVGEPRQGPFSQCAKGHVAIKPKTGDMLMFYDKIPSYLEEDRFSEHTGCPVIRGTKWNAVKWIHGEPFQPEQFAKQLQKDPDEPGTLIDPGICADLHEQCANWANGGECTKNPEYMLGHTDGRGMCRKVCNDCTACGDGDTECLQKNRQAAGFMSIDAAEFKGLLD